MKIVIDISEEDYKRIQDIPDVFNSLTSRMYSAIRNGTPLPEGAEILTKDAYSDLCRRAADVHGTNVGDLSSARLETHEKRTKTHACVCISRQAAIDAIRNLPSAQPEIIRCNQCKYAEVADPEDCQDGYTCQYHRGSIWFSGSYCSWAERRTKNDS